MKINGIEIDNSKLLSTQELLNRLKENGENDSALSDILGRYEQEFGNPLMWRYPISDGLHAGTAIVVVKEGFLSIPYDNVDKTEYELYELDHAAIFDEDALQCFIEDWVSYSDDLRGALGDMLCVVKGTEPKIPASRRMPSDRLAELFENVIASVSDLYEGGELYNMLHFSFGMSNEEIEKQGFAFQKYYLISEETSTDAANVS